MPASTSNRHYPYPLDPDPIDVAGDIQRLANAVDVDVNTIIGAAPVQIDTQRIRLSSTGDATLTSTNHAIQIGPTGGFNLILDQNEVLARQNGAPAQLILNEAGGLTHIGGTVEIDDNTTIHNGQLLLETGQLWVLDDVIQSGTPSAAGATDGAFIRQDGNIESVVTAGATPIALPNVRLDRCGSQSQEVGGVFLEFHRTTAGTLLGGVVIASATTVAYNTTSDPRLKQVTGNADDAATLVQQLGATAFRGRWLDPGTGQPEADGEEWIMLSSHDVEDVAPYLVTGARDAVDGDGKVVPQQVNYPAAVPLLCAALAQALDRIAALEAAAP